MEPSAIGERAEAEVLAALVQAGKEVFLPFRASCRYDLLFLEGGLAQRVQVKTGRLCKGAICFRAYSFTGKVLRGYENEVDHFGVYCHEVDRVYLVPFHAVAEVRTASLRIQQPRNAQVKGIRWAKDFLLSGEYQEEATQKEWPMSLDRQKQLPLGGA